MLCGYELSLSDSFQLRDRMTNEERHTINHTYLEKKSRCIQSPIIHVHHYCESAPNTLNVPIEITLIKSNIIKNFVVRSLI